MNLTKKQKKELVQEADNIIQDIRRSVVYNMLPEYAAEHLKQMDRLQQILPQIRDMITVELISKS